MNSLIKLAKIIDIKFNNDELFKRVFIHRSYLNEHKGYKGENNERLEFLGDAVLELVVTEYLYKNYPNPEGELTNWRSAIVKGEMLAKIAKKLDIGEFMQLSKGEEKAGGKAKNIILANTFEALIGAIYLDQGYDNAKKMINTQLLVELPNIIENKLFVDSKSQLQELVQEKNNVTPIYNVLKEIGPDHNKKFEIGVSVNDKMIGKGCGSSKQKAEQEAALDALDKLT